MQQTFITIAAIAVTALAVQATDQFATDGWLASVGTTTNGCEQHEVLLVFEGERLCVDAYEASAGSNCPLTDVSNGQDNQTNLTVAGCAAATQPDATPLRYVSYSQASQYCAHANKRLLTPKEWHRVAEALSGQESCNIQDRPPALRNTGDSACVTAAGVHDMVGNVWEWVDAEVVAGTYNGRAVPKEGYVQVVDTAGVVVETGDATPDPTFDSSYAWVRESEVGGIVKGGFYGSGTDAGRYAQQVGLALDTQTAGIGFRCVRDLF